MEVSEHPVPASRPLPAPVVAHPSARRPGRRVEVPEELRGRVFRAAELLREARRREPEPPLPTGVEALDGLLGGGLPRGAVVELSGSRSSGRLATLISALAVVTGMGEPAGLVDLGDHLDPRPAEAAGVDLARLLWLRPRRLAEALECAELLLGAGLPLVALDLGLPPLRGRVGPGAWMRLARAVREHGNALLVGSPHPVTGHAARAVLRLGGGRGLWSGRREGVPLLEGLPLEATVLRRRGEAPGERRVRELAVAERPLPSPAGTPAAPGAAPGRRRVAGGGRP